MSDEVWPMRRLYDVAELPPRTIVFTPMLFDLPPLSEAYAQACMIDSMQRGEAPIVPELLWGLEGELDAVIDLMAGWLQIAQKVVIYIDHPAYDETRAKAEAAAKLAGVELEERSIHGEVQKD